MRLGLFFFGQLTVQFLAGIPFFFDLLNQFLARVAHGLYFLGDRINLTQQGIVLFPGNLLQIVFLLHLERNLRKRGFCRCVRLTFLLEPCF